MNERGLLGTHASLTADLSLVLPMLAKLVLFVLYHQQPLAGTLPDFGDQALETLSPEGRAALHAIVRTDAHPESLNEALQYLHVWVDG